MALNKRIREFRQARPWLADDFGEDDTFGRIVPVRGSVIFYGLRHTPDGGESVFFSIHDEGEPRTLTPTELTVEGLTDGVWKVALKGAGMQVGSLDETLTMHDSEGVVWVRTNV